MLKTTSIHILSLILTWLNKFLPSWIIIMYSCKLDCLQSLWLLILVRTVDIAFKFFERNAGYETAFLGYLLPCFKSLNGFHFFWVFHYDPVWLKVDWFFCFLPFKFKDISSSYVFQSFYKVLINACLFLQLSWKNLWYYITMFSYFINSFFIMLPSL